MCSAGNQLINMIKIRDIFPSEKNFSFGQKTSAIYNRKCMHLKNLGRLWLAYTELQGEFYMVQLISSDSRHFTQHGIKNPAAWGYQERIWAAYTLLQKKRNFSEPIFPGDPGSLTLTPGHVLSTLFPKRNATFHAACLLKKSLWYQ